MYSSFQISVGAFFFIFGPVISQFGYGKHEQNRWQEEHRSCGGDLQSPIKIDSLKAIPIRMAALEMIRYHDVLAGPLILHNNGHSVSLSMAHLPPSHPEATFIPYVFGARLTNEYELEGIHFHWGDKNNLGSEHTFNDVRFPMEMHIVHRNRRYPTVAEAMNHTDGLTVLAFFYQLRENENKHLNQLVRYLPRVQEFDESVLINDTFTLASLLPPAEDMERFYLYRGSLTTPPCSEAVTWILFPNPMPVSVFQMNRFRSLSAHDPNLRLTNNYRNLQETGPRKVFVRKIRSRPSRHGNSVHYSRWDWLQH